MTEHHTSPLITFALFAYNQERFVREALEAALAQDYSPLEILISDDCSTDSTFEIIQSITESYKGAHRLVTNRNPENLGVARHVNRVMELVSGDLVVVAAADDVSTANRVSAIASYISVSEPRVYSACSAVTLINDDGQVVGKREISDPPSVMTSLTDGRRWVTGCSHAWSREVFDVFGPLRPGVVAEDKVIGFRAMLLGGRVGYVDEHLVKYRQHDQSISSASFVFRRSHMLLESVTSHHADLETLLASGRDVSHLDVPALKKQIGRLLKRARAYVRIADAGLIGGMFAWILNLAVVEPRVAAVILGAKIAGKRRNRRLPGKQADVNDA